MEPLQRHHKVLHAGHAVPLAAKPADELEAQLCREAAQVAQAHLLQQVASVSPQHHVDVHVLSALAVAAAERTEAEEGTRCCQALMNV